ncbi:uncharacterized protein EI97DRAFT_478786, partial [Westerdykella ornata]
HTKSILLFFFSFNPQVRGHGSRQAVHQEGPKGLQEVRQQDSRPTSLASALTSLLSSTPAHWASSSPSSSKASAPAVASASGEVPRAIPRGSSPSSDSPSRLLLRLRLPPGSASPGLPVVPVVLLLVLGRACSPGVEVVHHLLLFGFGRSSPCPGLLALLGCSSCCSSLPLVFLLLVNLLLPSSKPCPSGGGRRDGGPLRRLCGAEGV